MKTKLRTAIINIANITDTAIYFKFVTNLQTDALVRVYITTKNAVLIDKMQVGYSYAVVCQNEESGDAGFRWTWIEAYELGDKL